MEQINKRNITYRRAWFPDVDAIVELAIKSVSKSPWPVTINERLIHRTFEDAINPQDFAWVAEYEGKVIGSVVAISGYSLWHDGTILDVALYYSDVAGVTSKLLDLMVEWANNNEDIKVVTVTLEHDGLPATQKMFEKRGLTMKSTTLTMIKE